MPVIFPATRPLLRSAIAIALLIHGATARAQSSAPGEAPILPDGQFESQLPPLDPELEAALPPLPPADQATVADPALAEPLTPLGSFDVRTPEAPLRGEEEQPATVRYGLALEGLDRVGLDGRFRELSALAQGQGQAINGAMLAARARADEELAVRLLRSEGYYDATATAVIEPLANQSSRVTVTVTAAPGDRYRFADIQLTGPPTVPPTLAREALPLESGEPILAAAVEAAEANLLVRLPQQGYPFVEVGRRDILLDPATRRGDYTLPVQPGPRALFGGYRTTGDLAFDAEHVGVLARFDRGELYDSRKVDDLREAMVATGLFRTVSAEPVRTGQAGPGGTEFVTILVRQDAGPPRSISGSAGYNTGEGIRAEAAWEHRNLFRPEGALRLAVVGGTQEQSASVQFRRSNAGKRDRSVLLSAEAAHRRYEAYDARTATLIGRIARESTPIWQKRWTWSLGAEIIGTNESRFDPALQARGRERYLVGALPAQIGYDRSDNLLNPSRGFRLLGRVSPEVSLHGGASPYVRGLVEGSAYVPLSEQLVIAGRARFAAIAGTGRDTLAPSRRLYAGGGGSVRGFGYQELGPRDSNDDPLGGRSVNEFALEARYRFGDYGVVPFIDAGQVYEGPVPRLSNLRFGAGIGARVYTNFGPLRVDIASPLKRRRGEARFALYISIGQAF